MGRAGVAGAQRYAAHERGLPAEELTPLVLSNYAALHSDSTPPPGEYIYWPFARKIQGWTVDFPHKGPEMWKVYYYWDLKKITDILFTMTINSFTYM